MINFDKMDSLAFDAIEFARVETSSVTAPTPVRYNKFLKRSEFDPAASREQLLNLVSIDTEGFYQFILVVNLDGGTPEVFGFNYLKSRLIEPFDFCPSKNFNLAIDILLEPFCATTPTLLKYSRCVGPDGTGGGCSRQLINISDFIDNPSRYFEMHAPECYFESQHDI